MCTWGKQSVDLLKSWYLKRRCSRHHTMHSIMPGLVLQCLLDMPQLLPKFFNFLHYFPQYSRDTRPGACIANIVIPDSLHNSARLVALMPPSGRIEHPLAL